MTGPVFGIQLTIDGTGSKEGRDVHVRATEDAKRASAGLTQTFKSESAVVQDLAQAYQQAAKDRQAAAAEMLRAEQARSDAMTQASIRESQEYKRANLERIAALRAEADAFQARQRAEAAAAARPAYTVGLTKPAEDAALQSARRVIETTRAMWTSFAANVCVLGYRRSMGTRRCHRSPWSGSSDTVRRRW